MKTVCANNFFDAQTGLAALSQRLATHKGLVVACYCAAWCDTCREYRGGFEALAQRFPAHVFVWIDIEENEALLDDEDIENFPTLLVQAAGSNLFFGPMLPHPEHLERLLQSVTDTTPASLEGPGDLASLVASAAQ